MNAAIAPLAGSEKQVAWANSLREKAIAAFEAFKVVKTSRIEKLTKNGATDRADAESQELASVEEKLADLMLIEKSSFWIDIRNDLDYKNPLFAGALLIEAHEKAIKAGLIAL